MEQYAINGGNPLVGEVEIGGAKNAALPILAPRSRGQMTHHVFGHPLTTLPNYERILAKHHVFGASLLLQDGANCALCDTSTANPEHLAQENTLYLSLIHI